MNAVLVACTGNPEVLCSCFHMANLMLSEMDEVTIFLDGPAVRYSALSSERYPIMELASKFTSGRGVLKA